MPALTRWNWFLHPAHPNNPTTRQPAAFQLSYDQISQRLESLPRLFIEPDGSFVWRHDHTQLDGQLHDGPLGCMHIQIKGRPTATTWQGLLHAVDWPRQAIVIQLVERGVFVSEEEFRGMWWGSVGQD